MEEKIWHDLWWIHRLDSVWRYVGGIKCFSSIGIYVQKRLNGMGGDGGINS